MSKAATLRRTAETPTEAALRPRISLRVVRSRPRRRGHAATPAMITIEWFMLTMLGVVVLALATG
jgi:hypothetical protein